ncbi:potassium channel family protein [Botrimarina mediterranea]|uniref:Ion channel n=1 Tax=Botrimarina mediterranea TaxID=2528022 RepID=A0A518KCW4_9BACT|nr:potassium channel family protein [Botrimarina mediterranea]QDV75627.1 Ion channel [Botrimarina mediterranea]QDV80262.1 Ion channel [Planctomycetes bacterium K2D]
MLLFVIALLLTTITVLIHSVGMYVSLTFCQRFWKARSRHRWIRTEVLMVSLVGGLLVTHLLEMGVWATLYWSWGMLPDFETAAYYSSTSYTTVGYGDVVLPTKWRMLGPVEASVGVLMLGWSTAIIVAIVQKVSREGPKD